MRHSLAIVLIATAVLSGAAPALAQQAAPMGRAVRQACAADYKALCPGVRPGGGRILACFQQNAAQLSPGCRQALAQAQAAKQGS